MDFLHDQNCSTQLPSAKSPCTARRTCCLPHGRGPCGPPSCPFNLLSLALPLAFRQARSASNLDPLLITPRFRFYRPVFSQIPAACLRHPRRLCTQGTRSSRSRESFDATSSLVSTAFTGGGQVTTGYNETNEYKWGIATSSSSCQPRSFPFPRFPFPSNS